MFTRKKKIAALACAGVVALLLATPYLLPMSTFVPGLEARIAQRINEPVRIGELRLFLFPLPHLTASDITLGKYRLVHVNSLIIRFSLLSLLSNTRVIREVRLDGVQVRQGVFPKAVRWLKGEAAGRGADPENARPGVRIDRITLRNGEIRFRDFGLKALAADVEFADGKPAEIRATQHGDRLRVVARPQGNESWRLTISAHDWTVPGRLPVRFDHLQGEALVTGSAISTPKLSGALYGGTMSGPVTVSWKPAWSVSGQLELQKIDVEPLVVLLKRDVEISGKLTADPHFSLNGQDPAALLESLTLESDFTLEQGVIQKVDLVAAAKNPFDKQAGKGGKTEFDQLVGHLVIDPSGYQFSDIEVSSGLFKASGDITVNREQKLSGRIDVALRGTASLISMPLSVSGTVADPSLFLTKTAMAGAVAGSFLLPGIGTAAGIKASEFTDKLFGPKKPQRKKPAPATTTTTTTPQRSGRQ